MLFMSSAMTFAISTSDSAVTQSLAAKLATRLTGGEVIELVSDLGGGKTTFVQGLARGLGYEGAVTSPTFALSQIYKLPSFEIHHYDLYRLGQIGVLGDELAEDVKDPQVVTVIEWAGIVAEELPRDRLVINFKVTGENSRELSFASSGPASDRLAGALEP
jgi:tRNA threonylcarbamoyladenosine biosynthesis protein TsaE